MSIPVPPVIADQRRAVFKLREAAADGRIGRPRLPRSATSPLPEPKRRGRKVAEARLRIGNSTKNSPGRSTAPRVSVRRVTRSGLRRLPTNK
jgi:hypothetical protein